jgi:hypothetical protein
MSHRALLPVPELQDSSDAYTFFGCRAAQRLHSLRPMALPPCLANGPWTPLHASEDWSS